MAFSPFTVGGIKKYEEEHPEANAETTGEVPYGNPEDWTFEYASDEDSALEESDDPIALRIKELSNAGLIGKGRRFLGGAEDGTEAFEYDAEYAPAFIPQDEEGRALAKEVLSYQGATLGHFDRPFLVNRGRDGKIESYSTTESTVVPELDGTYSVIPTILRDKHGNAYRAESDTTAAEHYRDTELEDATHEVGAKVGERYGNFATEEEARNASQKIHDLHSKMYQSKWNHYLFEHWDEVSDSIKKDPSMKKAYAEWEAAGKPGVRFSRLKQEPQEVEETSEQKPVENIGILEHGVESLAAQTGYDFSKGEAAFLHIAPFARSAIEWGSNLNTASLEQLRSGEYDSKDFKDIMLDAGLDYDKVRARVQHEMIGVHPSSRQEYEDVTNERMRNIAREMATERLVQKTQRQKSAEAILDAKPLTTWGKIASGTLENSGYVLGFVAGSTMLPMVAVPAGASALTMIGIGAVNSVIASAPQSFIGGAARATGLANKSYDVDELGQLQVIDDNYDTMTSIFKGGVGSIVENTIVEGLTDEALSLGLLGFSKIPGVSQTVKALSRGTLKTGAGRMISRVGKFYHKYGQYTQFQSIPGEQLEEIIQPIFDDVVGLGKRNGEAHDTLGQYADKMFTTENQLDIFLGLVGTMGIQGGAATAQVLAHRFSEEGRSENERIKIARAGLVEAHADPKKVDALTDEEAVATYAAYVGMLKNPKSANAFAKELSERENSIFETLLNDEDSRIGRDLEQLGIERKKFKIPTIKDADGKEKVDFKDQMIINSLSGETFKGRMVQDEESGVCIIDNGKTAGMDGAFVVFDPRENIGYDCTSIANAVRVANIVIGNNQLYGVTDGMKLTFMQREIEQNYGGVKGFAARTIDEAVEYSKAHGLDVSKNANFNIHRKGWRLPDGSIVVVRDNINNALEFRELMRHEAVGHSDTMMQDIFLDSDDRSQIGMLRKENLERTGGADEERVKRESVANTVQRRTHHASLTDKMVAKINQMLGRKMGDAEMEIAAEEVERQLRESKDGNFDLAPIAQRIFEYGEGKSEIPTTTKPENKETKDEAGNVPHEEQAKPEPTAQGGSEAREEKSSAEVGERPSATGEFGEVGSYKPPKELGGGLTDGENAVLAYYRDRFMEADNEAERAKIRSEYEAYCKELYKNVSRRAAEKPEGEKQPTAPQAVEPPTANKPKSSKRAIELFIAAEKRAEKLASEVGRKDDVSPEMALEIKQGDMLDALSGFWNADSHDSKAVGDYIEAIRRVIELLPLGRDSIGVVDNMVGLQKLAGELADSREATAEQRSWLNQYRDAYHFRQSSVAYHEWLAKSKMEDTPAHYVEFVEKFKGKDRSGLDKQGNPIDANGNLVVESLGTLNDLHDDDFASPRRNVALPTLPQNVADALGTGKKPVVIKRNIFERNQQKHGDVTPEQSREILSTALYTPQLYGQNQKATKPYNWVVVSIPKSEGNNRLVLLEVNDSKGNVEIVHWHYVHNAALETIKKQAEREGGRILILPSASAKETGGLSSRPDGSSADSIAQTAPTSKGKEDASEASGNMRKDFGERISGIRPDEVRESIVNDATDEEVKSLADAYEKAYTSMEDKDYDTYYAKENEVVKAIKEREAKARRAAMPRKQASADEVIAQAKVPFNDAERVALEKAADVEGLEASDESPTDTSFLGTLSADAPIVRLNPANVDRSDAILPNMKKDANRTTGITKPLEGEYHPTMAGIGAAWLTQDGKIVVITGRHRSELAQRKGRSMLYYLYREADGFTKEMAQIYDAVANIHDEKGNINDYLGFLDHVKPTREQAEKAGILYGKGLTAWSLYADATEAVRGATALDGSPKEGQITPTQATTIAQAAPKNAHPRNAFIQSALLRTAKSTRMGADAFVGYCREMTRQLQSGNVNKNLLEGQQLDLFQDEEFLAMEALAIARNKYRQEKADGYSQVATNLRAALNRSGKLELTDEYAKDLGVTDKTDKKQLEKAYETALERADYWNPSGDRILSDEDTKTMDAAINAKADATAAKNKELKERIKAKIQAKKEGKPLPKEEKKPEAKKPEAKAEAPKSESPAPTKSDVTAETIQALRDEIDAIHHDSSLSNSEHRDRLIDAGSRYHDALKNASVETLLAIGNAKTKGSVANDRKFVDEIKSRGYKFSVAKDNFGWVKDELTPEQRAKVEREIRESWERYWDARGAQNFEAMPKQTRKRTIVMKNAKDDKALDAALNDFYSPELDSKTREKQTALSGGTSRNQNPSGNEYGKKWHIFKPGTRNVDIGAGRFDKATKFLADIGVTNLPFDPVNRTRAENESAANAVRKNPADTATVHNVLNVIDNDAVMEGIINQAARAIKKDGWAIFTVYEGNRSGKATPTRDGYQRNAKASAYVPSIQKYFGDVQTHGNVITARKPKDVGPAFWAYDSSFENGVDFMSEEFDPEVFSKRCTAAAKVVKILNKDGKGSFENLCRVLAERKPEKYEELRPYLRGVWNAVAEQLDAPEVSKDEAKRVYDIMDKNTLKEAANEDDGRGVRGEVSGGEPAAGRGGRVGVAGDESAAGARGESEGLLADGSVRSGNPDGRVDNIGPRNVPGLGEGVADRGAAEVPSRGDDARNETSGRVGSVPDQGVSEGSERETGRDRTGDGNRSRVEKAADKAAEETKVAPQRTDFVMTKAVEDAILEPNKTKRIKTEDVDFDSPELNARAEREYADVVARYTNADGTKQRGWMLAPNGKPTNLTERQWVQVRTPSFKAWFGDWESDPANASKVVDENGEPRPVYHGAGADFTVFDNEVYDGPRQIGANRGFFFTSDRRVAERYGKREKYTAEIDWDAILEGTSFKSEQEFRNFGDYLFALNTPQTDSAFFEKRDNYFGVQQKINDAKKAAERLSRPKVIEAFLNIRSSENINGEFVGVGLERDAFLVSAAERGLDGAVIHNADTGEGIADEYVVFSPTQIKSATDNTGAFDAGDADILFDSPELSPEAEDYVTADDKTPTEEVSRKVFGMTNDEIATEMRALNLQPSGHERKSDDVLAQQVETLLSRRSYMQKLAHAVRQFNRPVKDYEIVALGEYFYMCKDELEDRQSIMDDLLLIPKDERDEETVKLLDEAREELKVALTRVHEAGLAKMGAASEQGRALRANRMVIAQSSNDYSLAGILNSIGKNFGSVNKIPPALLAQAEELAKEFKDLDDEQRAAYTARLKAFSEKAVADLKSNGKRNKATERKMGDEEKRVMRNYLDAMAQIEVHADEAGGTLLGLGDQMQPSWGRWLKHIGEYHCFNNPNITEEEVMNAIVNDVSKFLVGVDANQVRDALTGFGHNFRQSRYDSQRLMNDLRSQARAKRQLDYMNEKNQLPPATGMVRDDPSLDLRKLNREVQERKKEVDEASGGQNRLKGALQSAKTRLRNRIEDLEEAIATGEKIERSTRTPVEDEEIRKLRERRDELQKVYDEMFKTERGLTDEQRVKALEKSLSRELERTLEDLARAKAGDFSPRTKRSRVTSATADALRQKIEDVKNSILELKSAAYEFGLTPEEIAKKHAQKFRAREAAILRAAERIEKGDLRKDVKPQPPMSKEDQKRYDEMGRQLKKAHQKLADMRLAAEENTTPSFWRKGKEWLKFVTAAQRAVKATLDFSAVLRQAARISLGHPTMAVRGFGKAWKSMANEASLQAVNDEIMSDESVQEAVEKYGLHLREIDVVNHRDVEMFHGMESSTINFFGKKVAIVDIPFFGELMLKSERHYITYLNAVSAELYSAIVNDTERFPGGATPWQKKMVCDLINIWNGSGAMSKERRQSWQKSGVNEILWAPGLALSRFQSVLGYDMWHPLTAKGIQAADKTFTPVSAEERKAIAKLGVREHVKSSLAMLALGALLRFLLSDDDEKDRWDNADWFEKLLMLAAPTIGSTTIDLTGGERSVYQLLHTLITSAKKSATGRTQELGKNFGGPTATSVISRFLEGKLSPWASELLAFINGKDYVGEEFTLKKAIVESVVPLTFTDLYDQVMETGILKALITIPFTLLGAGGSTYDRKPYENAVNPFEEALKEYREIENDESLDEETRAEILANIRESNPLMRDDVRDTIANDLRHIRRSERQAKKNEKNYGEPDEWLVPQIERDKKELLNAIREAKRR